MKANIHYFGFKSKWVRDRHITMATMKPGHLIRINKHNNLRFVIASRDLCTFDTSIRLPYHTIDGNSKDKLLVESSNGWDESILEGITMLDKSPNAFQDRKQGVHYTLEKLSERSIRELLKQTKFFLAVIDVVLPTFETKEQSNIAFEDA